MINFFKRLLSHESAKLDLPEQDFHQTQQFVTLTSETRQNNERLAKETDRLKELLERVQRDA